MGHIGRDHTSDASGDIPVRVGNGRLMTATSNSLIEADARHSFGDARNETANETGSGKDPAPCGAIQVVSRPFRKRALDSNTRIRCQSHGHGQPISSALRRRFLEAHSMPLPLRLEGQDG